MDAVMERRVLNRLGRFDKECGASYIPDDHECSSNKTKKVSPKKGTFSRNFAALLIKREKQYKEARQKEAEFRKKHPAKAILRDVLIVAALLGTSAALSKISQDKANRRAEKSMMDDFGVSPEEARKARKTVQDIFQKQGRRAAEKYYYGWAEEAYAEKTKREKHEAQYKTSSGEKWHETLGVSANATPAEIKSAYRKKSRETHPDINQGDDKGFGEVNEAWKIAQNLGKYKRGDAMDELDKAYEMGMRVAKSRVRRDSGPAIVPQSLHPQIVSTLKTVYGNGVLGVSNSKINKDGQIEGVFVGRSRPHEPAKVYNYGIDLVKQDVRFKRARTTRDSDDEECCGGKKKGCECHSCKAA
jgi:DnaJ-domain-containing protein 1